MSEREVYGVGGGCGASGETHGKECEKITCSLVNLESYHFFPCKWLIVSRVEIHRVTVLS